MSCPNGDENDDNCLDLRYSSTMLDNRLDSGYMTLTSSSFSSPSRLSPSSVILTQIDSPQSDHEQSSTINGVKRNFLSSIDYEHYISTRKHFDILTQLNHRNTSHLIDRILVCLSMNDRCACSNVNRRWHAIVNDYHRRQQTSHIKRNLFTSQTNTNATKTQTTRLSSTPMQTITNLLNVKPSIPIIVETMSDEKSQPSDCTLTSKSTDNTIHLAASTMTYRYGYLKYLHGPTIPKRCPICAYVSIVDVNDQHG
jgi:hypothetical protein